MGNKTGLEITVKELREVSSESGRPTFIEVDVGTTYESLRLQRYAGARDFTFSKEEYLASVVISVEVKIIGSSQAISSFADQLKRYAEEEHVGWYDYFSLKHDGMEGVELSIQIDPCSNVR